MSIFIFLFIWLAFCGFYSKNGDLFLSACQDTNIRIYDTKYNRFKQIKTVRARDVGWSVLDTDIRYLNF